MNQNDKNRLMEKIDKIRGQVSEAETNISRAKQNLYKLINEIDKDIW